MPPSNPDTPRNQQNHTDGNPAARQRSDQTRHMSVEEIASSYADVADELARWSRLDRLFAGRYRRRQFADADGRVLDVACGTGRNFRYLSGAREVVGVDVSEAMLAHARDELETLALDGTVHRMDAEVLAFPDDSFDTVVSSFATCTFPNPITALEEMGRVCEPDGRILLLEHGRSDVRPLAWLQDRRAESHYEKAGCRLNHEPLETARDSDLEIDATWDQFFGLVTGIVATPP